MFPARCAGCGVRAPIGLCGGCLVTLRPAPARPPPMGIDAWYAALAYEGATREAVARLKYRNARAPLALLVAMVDAVLPPLHADAVTWPPTTAQRRRHRGFDHAELLARALARRRGVAARPLLRRLDGDAQTGRGASTRRDGPAFAAAAAPPRTVLLVDDVATTGATLRNAARALRAQGCERVIGATVARTLLKRRGHDSDPHTMNTNLDGGHSLHTPAAAIDEPLDRATRVRHIGAQVKSGDYRPPLDGVVESLVVALLPHFQLHG